MESTNNSKGSGTRRAAAFFRALWMVALIPLVSCGGGGDGSLTTGGGSGSSGSGGGGSADSWTPGVFQPSAHFAAQCAAPRSGTDPVTGQ